MYPEEFRELYQEFLANAEIEADVLAQVADRADREVVRLRPGRRAPGQEPRERIDDEWCAACSTFHEAGHVCPTCTEKRARLGDEDLVDELEHLVGTATAEDLAARLGTSPHALARRLYRMGRNDLARVFERSGRTAC